MTSAGDMGLPAGAAGPRSRAGTARWLAALGVPARRRAPDLVDACLEVARAATSVLDLGGGHGEYALEFARRGLDTWMQDLPMVIDIARGRGRLEDAGVTLFAGSFFEEMPQRSFDLVLLAGVAHALPPDRLQELYREVHAVTAGTLVVPAAMGDDRACLAAAGFSAVTRHEFEGLSGHLLVGRA